MIRHPLAAAACAALLLTAPDAARADDVVKADALFEEGLALRPTRLREACAKFDAALRHNPQAIGILMNVALCDEQLGRIASAMARFAEARDRARELAQPQILAEANARLAALAPQLPRLTIALAEPRPAGVVVLVDRRVVPLDQLRELPVDPGTRDIVVSAPGRVSYHSELQIAPAEQRALDIPALARSVDAGTARRRAGQLTVLAGGAATVTGITLGVVAWRKYRNQFGAPDSPCSDTGGVVSCDERGQVATSSARTLGNVGTVVGALGVVALGVGGYLWWRAPRSDRELRVVPVASPDAAGVLAVGRF